MRLGTRWPVALLLSVGLALPACSSSAGEEAGAETDTVSVEHQEGSDVARVTLSEDAARRIDVQTAAVRSVGDGADARTVIPYAAVLYDPSGHTWAFTSPEHLVFERAAIRIDHIQGTRAVITVGPAVGTEVVTVGASELLGAEFEVGEE